MVDKHTLEPWFVDGPPSNQIVWSSPDDRVCFLAHSNGRDEARDIATGHLIAASPDLKAALTDMLAGWRYIRKLYGDLSGVGWDRAEDGAVAALMKAGWPADILGPPSSTLTDETTAKTSITKPVRTDSEKAK